jgi:acylphosphatase
MANQANTSTNDVRRLAIRFVGEVQGVGFRWTTRRLANSLQLTGWVRNEWDGSVSMELQGTDAQISEFFGGLMHAWGHFPPSYVIDQKDDIAPRDDEDYFQVRF